MDLLSNLAANDDVKKLVGLRALKRMLYDKGKAIEISPFWNEIITCYTSDNATIKRITTEVLSKANPSMLCWSQIIGYIIHDMSAKNTAFVDDALNLLPSVPPLVVKEYEDANPGSVSLFPSEKSSFEKSLTAARALVFTPEMVTCKTFQMKTWNAILAIIFNPLDSTVLAKAFSLTSRLLEMVTRYDSDFLSDGKYDSAILVQLLPICNEVLTQCCVHFGALSSSAEELKGSEAIGTISIVACKLFSLKCAQLFPCDFLAPLALSNLVDVSRAQLENVLLSHFARWLSDLSHNTVLRACRAASFVAHSVPLIAQKLREMTLKALFCLILINGEDNVTVFSHFGILSHLHHSIVNRVLPRLLIVISEFKPTARMKCLRVLLESALFSVNEEERQESSFGEFCQSYRTCPCEQLLCVSSECPKHFLTASEYYSLQNTAFEKKCTDSEEDCNCPFPHFNVQSRNVQCLCRTISAVRLKEFTSVLRNFYASWKVFSKDNKDSDLFINELMVAIIHILQMIASKQRNLVLDFLTHFLPNGIFSFSKVVIFQYLVLLDQIFSVHSVSESEEKFFKFFINAVLSEAIERFPSRPSLACISLVAKRLPVFVMKEVGPKFCEVAVKFLQDLKSSHESYGSVLKTITELKDYFVADEEFSQIARALRDVLENKKRFLNKYEIQWTETLLSNIENQKENCTFDLNSFSFSLDEKEAPNVLNFLVSYKLSLFDFSFSPRYCSKLFTRKRKETRSIINSSSDQILFTVFHLPNYKKRSVTLHIRMFAQAFVPSHELSVDYAERKVLILPSLPKNTERHVSLSFPLKNLEESEFSLTLSFDGFNYTNNPSFLVDDESVHIFPIGKYTVSCDTTLLRFPLTSQEWFLIWENCAYSRKESVCTKLKPSALVKKIEKRSIFFPSFEQLTEKCLVCCFSFASWFGDVFLLSVKQNSTSFIVKDSDQSVTNLSETEKSEIVFEVRTLNETALRLVFPFVRNELSSFFD